MSLPRARIVPTPRAALLIAGSAHRSPGFAPSHRNPTSDAIPPTSQTPDQAKMSAPHVARSTPTAARTDPMSPLPWMAIAGNT